MKIHGGSWEIFWELCEVALKLMGGVGEFLCLGKLRGSREALGRFIRFLEVVGGSIKIVGRAHWSMRMTYRSKPKYLQVCKQTQFVQCSLEGLDEH